MRAKISWPVLCALALVIASCDDKASNPPGSGNNSNGGKDQELLASCGSPVNFAGIDHCPVGSATLTPAGGQLVVSGFTGSGNDGVASDLNNVTGWSQTADIDWGGSGNAKVVYKAYSSGSLSSTMSVQQVGLTNDFNIWSDFTGGVDMRYRVELWGDGVLIAAQDNIDANGRTLLTNTVANKAGGKGASVTGRTWRQEASFDRWNLISPHPGACDFSYRPTDGTTFTSVRLPNGNSYTGVDKIEMIETTAPGHYPYADFQKIEVVGTISEYGIRDESAH